MITIDKERERGNKQPLRVLFCIVLLCFVALKCLGHPSCSQVATIRYTRIAHRPLSKTIFNIFNDKIVVTFVADRTEHVYTDANADSIYGVCELHSCITDTVNSLIHKIYFHDKIYDYILNDPSEWGESNDSNYFEIELCDGNVFEYSLGNINKPGTQYVWNRIVQYSYPFRKLVKLIEQIHGQLLTVYMFR